MQFLNDLAEPQRDILLSSFDNVVPQKQASHLNSRDALLTIMGKTTIGPEPIKLSTVLGSNTHGCIPKLSYKGTVWCPETEYGTFIARRNGCIYISGNSYVDEMRSHALTQLSQVGLMFDESKSDNPFAFYTQAVNHSFTRVLNLERRSQNIRDDMLIMTGAAPSITRQIDDELKSRFTTVEPEKPVKAKRKKAQAAEVMIKQD